MSSKALVTTNLNKTYFVYNKPHHRLLQRFSNRFAPRGVTVLDDVNIDIQKGEIIGIVGRNGAGKTTLLRILSGIMQPTSGTVQTTGRVGSILDLGFGLIGELSGLDNIYFIASLKEMPRDQVNKKLQTILDFCELGDSIHDPVLHYSTGMKMRLAYSISTHLDPDMLIIDEALAVGDEGFQHKCFEHLRSLSKQGVTIIFVSHSSQTIQEFCDRALLLEAGKVMKEGSPESVIQSYHRLIFASTSGKPPEEFDAPESSTEQSSEFNPTLTSNRTEYPSLGARIHHVRLEDMHGKQVNLINARTSYRYTYQVTFEQAFSQVRFGMLIKSMTGFEIGGSETSHLYTSVKAGETYTISFPFQCNLNPGSYYLNAGALSQVDGKEVFVARIIDAVKFQVKPNDLHQTGLVDFGIDPTITQCSI